jgi:cation:H+ antiporter
VGSNIFNILVILGVSALLSPLVVHRRLLRIDVPILIACSVGLALMAWDGHIGRPEGFVLTGCLVAYVVFSIRRARRDHTPNPRQTPDRRTQVTQSLRSLGSIVVGLGLLIWGSRWMVDGAVAAARWLEVSELIIALTVVAAGTGLPEVATSLIAIRKGERDIAVGNVVGSCIFNILFVMGLAGLVAPDGVAASKVALYFDVPVMLATAMICLPIFFTGFRVVRWEGMLLLGYYAAYILYLCLQSAQHDMLPAFSLTMALFVLPITVSVLIGLAIWHGVRNRQAV